MAYTPHTWNNEVITDAKLNALENGLAAASTLTGTDIDTDLDMSGNDITNANLLDCARVTPEVVLTPTFTSVPMLLTLAVTKLLNGGTVTSATKTFHKISGTGHVTVDLYAGPANTSYYGALTYRLYKNGVVEWSVVASAGESYYTPTVSESIVLAVETGDQVYLEIVVSGVIGDTTLTAEFSAAVSLPLTEGLIT